MALINKAANEITVKLVYYGPGLCGKTTNLEKIFADPKLGGKGKMLSVATETDRTLFFDFMPLEVGTIRGQKVRVQLYTVPGQVFYDATRRLVLRGADGVVFVADSQRAVAEANLESYRNLRDNLIINRIDPDKIPVVLQYNKRDLKDVLSVDELDELLNPGKVHPTFEAVALAGKGVTATLQKGIALILASIGRGVDLSLQDDDVRARAPRPSTVARPSAPPVIEPPPPPPPPPAEPPSARTVFLGEEDPFADEPVAEAAPPPPPRPAVASIEMPPPGVVSPPEIEAAPEFEAEPEPAPAVVSEPPSAPAPAPPAVSLDTVRAIAAANEQTMTLLRSILQDLQQQQVMLKSLLGKD